MTEKPLSTRTMVDFNVAIDDCTGGQLKVLKRDYLSAGRIPIIDQGQSFVAGYTNDDKTIYRGELPVVLFGDHTLTLKYVDFPFALGADGVKVLSISKAFDPKYMFYYWLSSPVQSRGYSRHFKYLREKKLPLIPIGEQQRIVEILDQADDLRKKRVAADTKTACILPALFYRIFGDPATNPKGWPIKRLGDPNLATVNPRFSGKGIPADREFSFVPMADVDEVWGRIIGNQVRPYSAVMRGFTPFQNNDVLFAKITPCMQNGKAAIARNLVGGHGFGSTEFHILRSGPEATPEWLYTLVRMAWFRRQAEASFTGTAGQQRVPADFLVRYEVPCPPLDLQHTFAKAFNRIVEWVDRTDQSRRKTNDIFTVILHRAFTSDLTRKWREAHMKELLAEMEAQAKQLNS